MKPGSQLGPPRRIGRDVAGEASRPLVDVHAITAAGYRSRLSIQAHGRRGLPDQRFDRGQRVGSPAGHCCVGSQGYLAAARARAHSGRGDRMGPEPEPDYGPRATQPTSLPK